MERPGFEYLLEVTVPGLADGRQEPGSRIIKFPQIAESIPNGAHQRIEVECQEDHHKRQYKDITPLGVVSRDIIPICHKSPYVTVLSDIPIFAF